MSEQDSDCLKPRAPDRHQIPMQQQTPLHAYEIHRRYRPELFNIIGGQPEELTHLQLFHAIVRYTSSNGLLHYDNEAERVWLDTSNTTLRHLIGLQPHEYVERCVFAHHGDEPGMSSWQNVTERVQARWVEPVVQVAEAQGAEAEQMTEAQWEEQMLQPS